MPNRDELITISLKRHNLAQWVKPRIDALLDGKEDRTRLSCCNGGCFVCVYDLLAVVHEVEKGGTGESGQLDGPTQ
jgi:hypothetical protein